MSHATVLVVGEDIEGQMAPYDEDIRVEPYKERVGLGPEAWPGRFIAKEAPEIDLLDPKAMYEWLQNHPEYKDWGIELDDEGLFEWSTYNPNSRWDWYTIGGRWMGSLIPKPGVVGTLGSPGAFGNDRRFPGGVDQLRKNEIDWDAMRQARVDGLNKRWDAYEAEVAEGKLEQPALRGLIYGFNEEDTRESMIAHINTVQFALTSHAVLHEGVWHEVGKMGWWGVSSDDVGDRIDWEVWQDQFLADLPDDALLTIVDYHI